MSQLGSVGAGSQQVLAGLVSQRRGQAFTAQQAELDRALSREQQAASLTAQQQAQQEELALRQSQAEADRALSLQQLQAQQAEGAANRQNALDLQNIQNEGFARREQAQAAEADKQRAFLAQQADLDRQEEERLRQEQQALQLRLAEAELAALEGVEGATEQVREAEAQLEQIAPQIAALQVEQVRSRNVFDKTLETLVTNVDLNAAEQAESVERIKTDIADAIGVTLDTAPGLSFTPTPGTFLDRLVTGIEFLYPLDPTGANARMRGEQVNKMRERFGQNLAMDLSGALRGLAADADAAQVEGFAANMVEYLQAPSTATSSARRAALKEEAMALFGSATVTAAVFETVGEALDAAIAPIEAKIRAGEESSEERQLRMSVARGAAADLKAMGAQDRQAAARRAKMTAAQVKTFIASGTDEEIASLIETLEREGLVDKADQVAAEALAARKRQAEVEEQLRKATERQQALTAAVGRGSRRVESETAVRALRGRVAALRGGE